MILVVYNRWTGLVDWTGGLDSWTRALDASDADRTKGQFFEKAIKHKKLI